MSETQLFTFSEVLQEKTGIKLCMSCQWALMAQEIVSKTKTTRYLYETMKHTEDVVTLLASFIFSHLL